MIGSIGSAVASYYGTQAENVTKAATQGQNDDADSAVKLLVAQEAVQSFSDEVENVEDILSLLL